MSEEIVIQRIILPLLRLQSSLILMIDQVFLLNKEQGWTSFDVVNYVRNRLSIKKLGHAGTLDPLATGLLILCSGKKTKSISEIQDMEKEYKGTFTLGATTASLDLETPIQTICSPLHLTNDLIEQVRQSFIGEQEQIPPSYSAVKVKGKRAYQMIRKGNIPVLLPRKVHIYNFQVTNIALPDVEFSIVCSKGTYIRSIARDFGERLKVGGYLSSLSRIRIGNYHVSDAYKARNLVDFYKNI